MTGNVESVRSLHAGESGTLVRTTSNGRWRRAGAAPPWAGTVRGPEGVRGWLETLNEHMTYKRFALAEIYGDADTVIEIVDAAGRAAGSQHPFASEIVRIWTFRGDKAVRVRSYYDTAAYERSFLG